MVLSKDRRFPGNDILPFLLAVLLLFSGLFPASGPGLADIHIPRISFGQPPSGPEGGNGDGLPFLPATAQTSVSTTGKSSATSTSSSKKSSSSKGVKGIDVSKYQGNINWKKVAGDGIQFAFCRATYGRIIDPYFYQNVQGASKNGIAVGAYHFPTFKSTASAKKEASYFVSVLSKAKGSLNLPVVLDLELTYGMNRAKLTAAALAFMETVEDAGYTVILYSNENFLNDKINLSSFKGYDLWVANTINAVKLDHVIWQHSHKGKVSGISGSVDLNISHVSVSQLKSKAKNGSGSVSSASSSGSSASSSGGTTAVSIGTGAIPTGTAGTTTSASVKNTKSGSSGSGAQSGGGSTSSTKSKAADVSPPADGTIRVNKASAQRIQETLTIRYGASFSDGSLVLTEFRGALVTGLQKELNKQYGARLKVTGQMDDATKEAISRVSLSPDEENHIVYLTQCALYFKGSFTGSISGSYDSNTRTMVKNYQSAQKLPVKTGSLDADTLISIFEFK